MTEFALLPFIIEAFAEIDFFLWYSKTFEAFFIN